MIRAYQYIFILLIAIAGYSPSAAQQKIVPAGNNGVLKTYQDSLQKVSNRLYEGATNDQRYEQNAKFIKMLVSALKTPGSFNFGFDSLKAISIVKSPDLSFRIFSWYVPTQEGTYRFFGTIQMATADGKLKLYPLLDDTEHLTDNNQLTSNKAWYGARYYEIVPMDQKAGRPAYLLLGWKGNSNKTSKKVIEVISFENDLVQFGKPVFQDKKDEPAKNRIVFEYNKLNSMTLRYDRNEKMIVFDHLAPYDPNMAGNFEYYASDSSFDGYKQLGSKMKLMENIELKNDPNELDVYYIDPKQKDIPSVKKF
jgi:hypothetical protein